MTFLEHVLNSDSGRSRVTISWTVFVCEVGTEAVTCSRTGKADIPGYLLATRPFGRCILIGTLLEAIDDANGTTLWLDFVSGRDHAGLALTWVSTIRSPAFGGQLRRPTSGYEVLGPYERVRDLTGMPSPAYADTKEAVSCDPDSADVQSFFRAWSQRKGIEPENHFFIIFEVPRSSPSPPPPSLPWDVSKAGPSSTLAPAPPFTQPTQAHLQPSSSLLPNMTLGQATIIPPFQEPIHSDLDDEPPNTETDSLTHEHQLTTSLSIKEVCKIIGISTAIYEAAFYHAANRNTPLYAVLKNFKPLLNILEVLGLDDPKGNRSYSGGLVLGNSDVLEFFRWNPFSYNKKYIAYRWAQKMAGARWKGLIPSKGKALYSRRWRGIVWFFQPGGGLDRETPPDKLRRSIDPDEVAAAELKQTMLLDRRKELEDVLILR
ncbi:hypothetical protein BDN72DRAFT_902456 [Pluteus cervinus]|uniref:Uncharacterized protein n=1 Tax=Pluteus cervinus TaxID=181527 RepID=A0ACD3ACR4_9AGAR|nr:hypothetical protein BDN72DRAFT_902456 [Pluteus cervinus]